MPLTAGTRLGPYEVLGLIGAGGMGEVYRARDTRLGREVAIKTVNAPYTERFEREARAISALNHPHVCTLYDVGSIGATAYLVMELVEGQPIQGPLPWTEAARHVADVCDALGAAHRKHVVHRDLKPGNVLLTPLGVKVIDFGLARQDQAGEATSAVSTRVGTVMGTVGYMSPEQAAGQSGDPRSDLWAVGMLLFELLSGRLPFRSRNASSMLAEIVDPVPLAVELPPDVPRDVTRVVEKLLSKDPAARYQHADDVAVDLRALLRVTTPDTLATRAVARLRGRTRRSWAAAVIALVLTVGAGAGVWHFQRPHARAPLPSAVPEANEYLSRALLFMGTRQDLPRARQMLEKALALDPAFAYARACYGLADLLMIDSGASNDTSWLYRAEANLRRALEDDPGLARAHATLAYAHIYQGRQDLALQEVRRAIELDPKEKEGSSVLAIYHQYNGEYEQSQALVRGLLEIDPLFFPARVNLGENLRQMGDPAGSIREQEKVLEQDPNNTTALMVIGMARLTQGNAVKAREALLRARSLEPQNYQVRLLWALLLAVEGRREEAMREMDADVLKYGELIIFSSYVAEFYAVLGDRAAALDWLDRAARSGDGRAEWFERDPLLASVRGEPRFRQIVDGIRYRREQRNKPA